MSSLQRWLTDGIAFEPLYLPQNNSDHLPMALVSLESLGAPEDFLGTFREEYASRLQRGERTVEPIPDWRQALGQRDAYRPALERFRIEIDAHGTDAIVGQVVAETVCACPVDAFHPMLRLGFALTAGNTDELAAALAYLTTTRVVLPAADEPRDLAAALRAQAALPEPVGEGRFLENILALDAAGAYPVGRAQSLEACAHVALTIFRSTRNFFALHMVTVTQAARVIDAHAPAAPVLASLTGALLAAHRVLGSPEFDEADVLPVQPLDAPHVYKYAYACEQESKAYADPRYQDELDRYRQAGLLPVWRSEGSGAM